MTRGTMYSYFPEEEYKERFAKARKLMEEYGIDALIINDRENMEYFTGVPKTTFAKYFERIAVLPRDGEPVLAVPRIIRGIAMKSSWIDDLRAWGGGKEGAALGLEKDSKKFFISILKELNLSNKVVGMEVGNGMLLDMPYELFEAVKNAFPSMKIMNAVDLFWKVRSIKSPREREIIQKLLEIACKGYNVGLESARAGWTERDLARTIWETWVSEGAHDSRMMGFVHIRSGKDRYIMGMARPSDRKLRKGDLVMLDGGPAYKGYACDFGRLASVGEPVERTKRLFEAALEATDAGIKAVMPGVRACNVYQAVEDSLKSSGYDWTFRCEFAGHGMGKEIYERLWITPEDKTQLEDGMYIAIEVPLYDLPTLKDYLLWAFIEDNGFVTDNGFDNVTGERLERKLWIIK